MSSAQKTLLRQPHLRLAGCFLLPRLAHFWLELKPCFIFNRGFCSPFTQYIDSYNWALFFLPNYITRINSWLKTPLENHTGLSGGEKGKCSSESQPFRKALTVGEVGRAGFSASLLAANPQSSLSSRPAAYSALLCRPGQSGCSRGWVPLCS